MEILKLLTSSSSTIAQGEVLQLEYRGEIDILEETYFKIINSKTAALFAAATRVGACITNKNRKEKDALESYGRNLGLAFQIADDALDYYSTNKIFGKEIGKDFYEGKVTLPAILLHQKANLAERIFLEKIFFIFVTFSDCENKSISPLLFINNLAFGMGEKAES